jgi:hypothetical protein
VRPVVSDTCDNLAVKEVNEWKRSFLPEVNVVGACKRVFCGMVSAPFLPWRAFLHTSQLADDVGNPCVCVKEVGKTDEERIGFGDAGQNLPSDEGRLWILVGCNPPKG